MKQEGIVISVGEKGFATVTVGRRSMCDGCHNAENCSGECSMYKIFGGKKEFSATAKNKAGARVGDRVSVETKDSNVLLSAFIVFMLPLIIAFVLYGILKGYVSEELSLVYALASFAVYFLVLCIIERVKKNKSSKLVITDILNSNNSDWDK